MRSNIPVMTWWAFLRGWATVAGTVAFMLLAAPPMAHGQGCSRTDFETVVISASSTLKDMTARNSPTFQEKLRALKDKRAWSYEQFVKEAAPLVADDRISAYDAKSMALLEQINSMGGEGAGGTKPDCKLLDSLRAEMGALVDTQTRKWTYMFAKLEAELAK